jgi:hypothetical protein
VGKIGCDGALSASRITKLNVYAAKYISHQKSLGTAKKEKDLESVTPAKKVERQKIVAMGLKVIIGSLKTKRLVKNIC